MNERFLRKKEVAQKMNCGWKKARSILARQGVFPVDYGVGKGGGLRWLESAVDAAILAMHQKAQPHPPTRRVPKPLAGMSMPLSEMRAGELYAYLENQTAVQ